MYKNDLGPLSGRRKKLNEVGRGGGGEEETAGRKGEEGGNGRGRASVGDPRARTHCGQAARQMAPHKERTRSRDTNRQRVAAETNTSLPRTCTQRVLQTREGGEGGGAKGGWLSRRLEEEKESDERQKWRIGAEDEKGQGDGDGRRSQMRWTFQGAGGTCGDTLAGLPRLVRTQEHGWRRSQMRWTFQGAGGTRVSKTLG
jgi:hypothetical protein